MKLWYLDYINECVEEGTAIRRDSEGWHIVGYGYVSDENAFETESQAKEALKTLLQKRLLVISERLRRLEG